MKKTVLREYAKLIVRCGVNVQKGQEVIVYADLDQPEFVQMVVEEAYKAKARKVIVEWNYQPLAKIHVRYKSVKVLGEVPEWEKARRQHMVDTIPCVIHIISEDPDALKGVNQAKRAKARMKSYPKIKKYLDALEGKYKWVIAAVPGKPWAKKVFPDLPEEEAVEKLWEAILSTSRVDGNDPVENWKNHNSFIKTQSAKLNALDLRKLKYSAQNGTNFEVELIPGVIWAGGAEEAKGKSQYHPNIPSEEVFTCPYRGKAEGTLVASKPLSYNGEVIDGFSITFKEGKVVSVHAEKNQALLEKMVKMDEGASMLGEVALVPYSSPIRKTGILFYNTLFDENAVCHFALGRGFIECLPNGLEMTPEEAKNHGLNDSMIHVDFMIGTEDLSIVGYDKDGKEYQIFKDGEWAL